MGNIYDGVFRTILNDCRKLVIPLVNEIYIEIAECSRLSLAEVEQLAGRRMV